MSQVHRSNGFRRRRFFQQYVAGMDMHPGFKEILQFREGLVYVGSELDLGTGPLFNKSLAEPSQIPQMQDVNIPFGHKAGRIGHQCFGNEEGIQLIRLGLPDVVSPETGCLDGVQDTNLIAMQHKKFNKIVTIMCRRLQSDYEVVSTKRFQFGLQLTEAVSAVREGKRLQQDFTV